MLSTLASFKFGEGGMWTVEMNCDMAKLRIKKKNVKFIFKFKVQLLFQRNND